MNGGSRENVPIAIRASVVIPVYNEVSTVASVVRRVLERPEVLEAVVVDDCSTDGTDRVLAEIAQDRLRYFRHERNQGKGAALHTGFAQVRGNVVIVQDADFEYDPADYPVLLKPIAEGRADVVYGSRFLGGPHRVLLFWHYAGNRGLTLLSNVITNLNLTDMETGAKAFLTDTLKAVTLKENGFGFEPEVTAKLARLGARIYETPVSYAGRTYAEGKKITWVDAVEVPWVLFRARFLDKL
jgi:glycosyltransferase involved in cell wall biosynthesis